MYTLTDHISLSQKILRSPFNIKFQFTSQLSVKTRHLYHTFLFTLTFQAEVKQERTFDKQDGNDDFETLSIVFFENTRMMT